MHRGIAALRMASPEEILPSPRHSEPVPVVAAVVEATMTFPMRSWVTPTGSPAIFVTKQLRVGGATTISGPTGTGKMASVTVASPKDLTPTWALRVAALLRVADFDTKFDPVIKGILESRGLPVDQSINWDTALNRMWVKRGVWPHDENRREESIQDAIVTVLVVRHTLQNWDPTKSVMKDGQTPLPPAEKLTGYLLRWFLYYCTEKGGARDKSIIQKKELGTDMIPGSGPDSYTGLWEDLLPSDDASPADEAMQEADTRDFSKAIEHFLAFVRRTRAPKMAENITDLLKIIQSTHSGVDVAERWAATGRTDSYLRTTLGALREAFQAYRGRADVPPSRFLDLLKGVPVSTPKVKQAPVPSDGLTKASALQEHPFVSHVVATLVAVLDRRARVAKPEITQESVVYVRLGANDGDPRFMDISFYAPGVSQQAEGAEDYKVEVGDWETDRGLNEAKIRKQLSSLVFPAMRGDIMEEHRPLLEKVIARLRSIIWENACDYFQVPLGDKAQWQNVIKMDVQKIQDLRVHVRDKEMGQSVTIAASITEGSIGRKSARSLAGEENLTPAEQTDLAPDPTKMASAPGHAYETANGATVCRACATKAGGAPSFSKTLLRAEDAQGRVCTRCFAPLGKPVVAGRQEPDALEAGKAIFDPDFHGPEDEPALTWLADALKNKGLKDDADNVSAATEGFDAARDAHFKSTTKESSMATRTKFAALKRIAAEDPGAFNAAIDFIKGKLSDGINNLTILQENLGAVTLDDKGENPQPVEGEAKYAAFKRIAAETPELMEEALGEAYGDMDETMAMLENLADQLDIDLPTPGEPDEVEVEVVPEKDGDADLEDKVPAPEKKEDKPKDSE